MTSKKQCFVHPTSTWATFYDRRNCHITKLYDFEGHSYCVLHLPDDSKGQTTDFNAVIKQKLDSQENDFSWVYFPDHFDIGRGHAFAGYTSFQHATFKKQAFFWDAKFEKETFFMEITFKGEARFSFASFSSSAYFQRSEFFALADFSFAKFAGMAEFRECAFADVVNFESSRFKDRADFAPIHGIDAENPMQHQLKPIPDAKFSQAEFEADASFRSSLFTKVKFFLTEFKSDADFWAMEIHSEGDFHKARFNQTANFTHLFLKAGAVAEFRQAVFKESVYFDNRFWGDDFADASLTFADAIAEQPERFRFHSLVLRPHWFINFDCRKVDFTNVYWINSHGTVAEIKKELQSISEQQGPFNIRHVSEPDSYRLLTYTYRELAENYENRQRFMLASRFRRAAHEIQTLYRKKAQLEWLREEFLTWEFFRTLWEKVKEAPFDLAYFLYRISSFYGESSMRALLVLLLIVGVVMVLLSIPASTFKDGQHLSLWESFLYSLRLIVLQRPEPLPESGLAKTVTTFGSLLAPVQFALLALALRRKFVR
ncbi:MAG: pentapeptide repeat-containing protein [Pyrinomonadaceae bacterium]